MRHLIQLFGDAILGTLTGYDRLVFQGRIAPISYAEGAERFFRSFGILFKNTKTWMQEQTARLIEDVQSYALRECGTGIQYIESTRDRKDDLVRRHQDQTGIRTGLIGAWACTEACNTFTIVPAPHAPKLRFKRSRCKHLYLYFDHPLYGFMSIRLQTWFPYMIQVAMNGREWLARELNHRGVGFERHRNKIINCDDFALAQQILNDQAFQTEWMSVLTPFVDTIFPGHADILGPAYDYSWYGWQTEWASDLIFADQAQLKQIMEQMIVHALRTGRIDNVLRFHDQAINQDGMIRKNASHDYRGTVMHFADGVSIRFELDGNKHKLYCHLNTMRLENTINNPSRFKIDRPVGDSGVTKHAPMRKTVYDLARRAHIGNDINNRFAECLATINDHSELVESTVLPHCQPHREHGRRIRALVPFGKDLAIVKAIAKPELEINGFANKDIRAILRTDGEFKNKTDKQLAGYVSRTIRVLRDHHLLRKRNNEQRYHLSTTGRQFTAAVLAVLSADITRLTESAA